MTKKEKKPMNFPYEIKDIILDKDSMELIELVNQRQIRQTQVNSILRSLKKGEHFDSMFVVNVNNGKKKVRVIDGGHRTTALDKYFAKVRVSMAVYKDLTAHEEKIVYTKWNLGVKQTIEDFINSYRSEIPLYDYMLEMLPVSIYGSKNKMRLRYIVDAYLSSKTDPYSSYLGFSKMEWVEALKKINDADIESMNDTYEIVVKIFNPSNLVDFMRLSAFKFSNFKAIFRLIHVNKVLLGRNYVIKRMSKVLYKSSVVDSNRNIHRQGLIEAFNIYKQMLNSGVQHKFK